MYEENRRERKKEAKTGKNLGEKKKIRTKKQKTEAKTKFLRSRMRLIEMDRFWAEKRRQKIEGSPCLIQGKPGTKGNNGSFG